MKAIIENNFLKFRILLIFMLLYRVNKYFVLFRVNINIDMNYNINIYR